MKNSIIPALLLASLSLVVLGCGSSTDGPPPGAQRPVSTAPAHDPSKPWTKEEKIAAINRAPISEEQKKAEIAKVNAGN